MANKRKVLYKKSFEQDFEEVYDYINQDSEQNAKKFAQEVKNKIEKIIKNPTAQSPEILIYSKQNCYRFKNVMKSWKIIFKVTKSILVFLSIIHIKRNPNKIKKLRTSNYD